MIAIETGAIGHNMCIVSACATGTHNVAEGAEAIRRGDCIAVIRGSTRDAAARGRPRRLREHARHGHAAPRRAGSRRCRGRSTRRATASSSARAPARLFLEDLELAKARGAKIYAEVVGYGSAADGWDMIQPIDRRRRAPPGR